MMEKERYNKMCQKADEIQEQWKVRNGDCALYKLDRSLGFEYGFIDEHVRLGVEHHKKEYVWLPNVEDLAGMLEFKDCAPRKLIFALRETMALDAGNYNNDMSMREIWMVWVMKARFGKEWTGSDWVKV